VEVDAIVTRQAAVTDVAGLGDLGNISTDQLNDIA
jgi:hypothetical protein